MNPEKKLTKTIARQQARNFLNEWSQVPENIAALKNNLRDLLRSLLKPGSRCLATLPLPDEVDLLPLLAEFPLEIYAPITLPQREMDFRLYMDSGKVISSVKKGYMNVPGPSEQAPGLQTPLTSDDIIIIPGLAVNSQGHRLGRGGGYYDHFKKNMNHARKIGLIPSKLTGIEFEFEAHDVKLETVATEKEIIQF